MADFVALHAWALVIALSVLAFWCVAGWARVASRSAEPQSAGTDLSQGNPAPAKPWRDWREDVAQVGGAGDLERLCDRWRGRVPAREK